MQFGSKTTALSLVISLLVVGGLVTSVYLAQTVTSDQSFAKEKKSDPHDIRGGKAKCEKEHKVWLKGGGCYDVPLKNEAPSSSKNAQKAASVRDRKGYCAEKLDCNNSGGVPGGSYRCESPVNGQAMNCCPPGQHRVWGQDHKEPGTCQ